jgi:hypothetical protein
VSRILLSTFLCIFSLSLKGATLFNTPALHCEMTQATASSSATELVFSVRNRLDKEVKLLSWYTPLEGLMSDLFIITDDDGEALPYQGMMVKRGAPQESDYIAIPVGEAVEVVLELGLAYPFDSGEYQITLKPLMWEYRIGDKEFKGECGRETITIRLE